MSLPPASQAESQDSMRPWNPSARTENDSDYVGRYDKVLGWRWAADGHRIAEFRVRKIGQTDDDAEWELEPDLQGPTRPLVEAFSARSGVPADRVQDELSEYQAGSVLLHRIYTADDIWDDDPHASGLEDDTTDSLQQEEAEPPESWSQYATMSGPGLTNSEQPVNIDSHATQFLGRLDTQGIKGLVDLIIEKEYTGPKTSLRKLLLQPTLTAFARNKMTVMLASMDPELLRSCIKRTLTSESQIHDHPTRAALRANAAVASRFPCQYINILCAKDGRAPTPEQCDAVVTDITLYLLNDARSRELAAKIDTAIVSTSIWDEKYWSRGLRKYVDWRSVVVNKTLATDSGRRKIVRFFLDELKRDIAPRRGQPSWTQPRQAPFTEVGYSNTPLRRLKQHANHQSSNYLMNLVYAAFQNRFPELFVLQQEILLPCFESVQPWLGEIVFSQLACAYTKNAGGFSHYPAGLSNGSAYRQRHARDWDTLSADARDRTPLMAHLRSDQYMNGSGSSTDAATAAETMERTRAKKILECQIKAQELEKLAQRLGRDAHNS